jgi:hypothetical protein
MRKLIVNNFVTVDGYYEAKDKTIDGLFAYYHEDYIDDQNFDYYAAERLRAADTLILSGRTSFLGNKQYWTGVPDDANATPIRREIAALYTRIDKIVVSDKIAQHELTPWEHTWYFVIRSRPKQQRGTQHSGSTNGRDYSCTTARDRCAGSVAHPYPPDQTDTSRSQHNVMKSFAVHDNERAEAAINQNAEDGLIVEGVQAFDPDLKGIAVWGTNVTTQSLY